MSSQNSPLKGAKALIENGKGEIESAVIASQDGILVEESGANGISDILAALGAALAAGIDEAFRIHFNVGFSRVTVTLEDGRLMIVKPVRDQVLCAVTKPKPLLGRVYYLIDKYSENNYDANSA